MCAALFESLESRRLLAGVTLITHGRDGHIWGFNQTVANEITTRLGGPAQAPQYLLKLAPTTADGPLVPTLTKVAGTGSPQASTSGEIILLVDWTSVDDNPNYQLSGIADVITNVFMNTTVDGVRLAELPLHGVSISRGTGLLDEVAWSLGHNGVWVDQLTYCDPNPVEAMGDASPTVYDNVAFVDNYWRWDGDPNNQSTNGSAVAGAYNLNVWWLDNNPTGWETKHIIPGGYYVGTINTTTTNGGEGPIYPEWYGTTADKPARTQTGFIYSSIIGATRPLSGVWEASGGTGTRTETGWEGNQWANVTDVRVTNGTVFNSTSTINISYLHQDRDSDNTVTFFLDADRNPYNGAFAKNLGNATFSASDSAAGSSLSGVVSGVSSGSYYVAARITDNQGHTRFSYSKPITINGSTSGVTYVSDMVPSTTTNGWGPYEKDRSNGESGAGDGRTLTLNGVTYAKGLGVHAISDLTYSLNKQFSQFNSDIGIDDEKSTGSVVFQVYLDGVRAYDSGTMTGSSATKQVTLNVSNVQTMRLVVTDGGNGNDSDHADWANARLSLSTTPPTEPPPGENTTTFLSVLNPTSATNGWGSYERDKSNGESGPADGNTLTLNGTTYTKGLGVHANSDLTYNLGGQYSTFASDIGVDDEAGNSGSVIFQVYLDGVKVYDSGVMTGSSATKQISFNTSGKSTLRLMVTDAGNGATFDHGDWAGARLLGGSGTTPTDPPPPPPPTTTAPPAPGSFNAVYNVSTKRVQLNWSPPTTGNQTGYRLERKLGANGTWAVLADNLSKLSTAYTDSGPFTASSTYFYRVFAFNSAGDSSPSPEKSVNIPAPTPTRTFLSDMTPIGTVVNGWGAYEKDRSNGETGDNDGNVITLNGVQYTKGLGVHAFSDISFNLNKQFRTFTSDIGVDDEKGGGGSVFFQVFADGVKIYDSGLMTGPSPTKGVNVSVTNVTTLRLVVTDGGNGADSDHADWANAVVNP